MSKCTITDVWGEVQEVNYDEDEDEDELEQEYEDYGIKDDDAAIDISELDAGDPRLFPNIYKEYYDAIKWLTNPKDGRHKPPLYIFGGSLCYGELPEYGCGHFLATGEIQVGQHLDVVSLLLDSRCRLLRRGGATVDLYIKPETLKGKYVVVVCVCAPTRWVENNSNLLCQLRIVSEQLSEARNFEMVIVAKMKVKCEGYKDAFNKLISAFPGCLFVPFEDDEVRDEICQRLNFRGSLKAILVDHNHKVAQNCVSDIVANYYYPTRMYRKYITKLKYLSSNWIRPPLPSREMSEKYLSSSLTWLLDSSYGDPALRLHSLSSSETITVGKLSNKLVGVYLYQVGDKLDSLVKVYDQCRQMGLDFHIVVVCVSLFSNVDPLVFYDVVIGELEKLIPDTPWWVLPYNAATYSTLFKLSESFHTDTIITVGPSRKFFVDVCGGDLVHHFGIEAYPFNREVIVRKYEQGAKSITLDSLLSHGDINYVVRGGKRVPVADLYDKVVVVYTDFESKHDSYTYKCLSHWYNEIRKQHSDFEVVFVFYDEPNSKIKEQPLADMEFLVRPFDPEHSKVLRDYKSFFAGDDGDGYAMEGLCPDSKLLFGKGGHLCALNALVRFDQYGLDAFPYTSGCGDDYLRVEIMLSIVSEFDFMGSYWGEKPYDVVSLDPRSTRGK